MWFMAEPIEAALRPLADEERQILEVLLAEQFPGKEALAAQLLQTQARRVDAEGSLELVVSGGPLADVVRRIPVEAEVDDIDGTTIHVLLHVVDGFLNELELFREDGGVIKGLISPNGLRTLVL